MSLLPPLSSSSLFYYILENTRICLIFLSPCLYCHWLLDWLVSSQFAKAPKKLKNRNKRVTKTRKLCSGETSEQSDIGRNKRWNETMIVCSVEGVKSYVLTHTIRYRYDIDNFNFWYFKEFFITLNKRNFIIFLFTTNPKFIIQFTPFYIIIPRSLKMHF